MQPIGLSSIGAGQLYSAPQVNQAAGSSTAASATSVTATSTNTVLSINQQVSSFLNSVNPSLANNQNLKLLIAALIIQFLLGDGNTQQQAGQIGPNMLDSLGASRQGSLQMTLESQTNTVQIEQQSARLDTIGAVQTMQSSDAAHTRPGGQIDLSA